MARSHNYWKVGKDSHIIQNTVLWECSSKVSSHSSILAPMARQNNRHWLCSLSLFSANTKRTSLKKTYKYSGRASFGTFLGLTLLLLILLKENTICVSEKVPPKQPESLFPKYQMSYYWKTSVKAYWDFYHSFVVLCYMYSTMNTVVETEEICWLFDSRD